jgi:aminoglycoside phosphotransferase (APT) family kinase protein
VPRDASWNPVADELRMEAVPAADLADHVEACGLLEPAVGAAVGRAVGELHAEDLDLGSEVPRSDWLQGGVGIARPTPKRLHTLSAGGIDLLKLLQRSDELDARLRALAPPTVESLVHGDLRWENVLVAPDAEIQVWLVDWEMGGAGETAWDAGCFAAACLSAWLCSIPSVPGVRPDRLEDEATLPWAALAPGLDAFWSAYRGIAPETHADAWTARCAQLTAVRLVYRAFECTQFDTSLGTTPVLHLQVAARILDDPVHAAGELLRIP